MVLICTQEDEILQSQADAAPKDKGFGAKQAEELAEFLTSVVLPGTI
jgi:hypothetical protein